MMAALVAMLAIGFNECSGTSHKQSQNIQSDYVLQLVGLDAMPVDSVAVPSTTNQNRLALCGYASAYLGHHKYYASIWKVGTAHAPRSVACFSTSCAHSRTYRQIAFYRQLRTPSLTKTARSTGYQRLTPRGDPPNRLT